MEIQGPFTISVNDNSETGLRELHLGFKPGFQQQDLQSRLSSMQEYLNSLEQDISSETDENNKQGMLTILQIAQQLQPHLKTDDIPLGETIIVEIGPSQSSPFDDLVRGATLK